VNAADRGRDATWRSLHWPESGGSGGDSRSSARRCGGGVNAAGRGTDATWRLLRWDGYGVELARAR